MFALTQDQKALEDLWFFKLREALARYGNAKAEYSRALNRRGDAIPSASAITRANNERSAALTEYRRVARIYTDLMAKGKIPPEE